MASVGTGEPAELDEIDSRSDAQKLIDEVRAVLDLIRPTLGHQMGVSVDTLESLLSTGPKTAGDEDVRAWSSDVIKRIVQLADKSVEIQGDKILEQDSSVSVEDKAAARRNIETVTASIRGLQERLTLQDDDSAQIAEFQAHVAKILVDKVVKLQQEIATSGETVAQAKTLEQKQQAIREMESEIEIIKELDGRFPKDVEGSEDIAEVLADATGYYVEAVRAVYGEDDRDQLIPRAHAEYAKACVRNAIAKVKKDGVNKDVAGAIIDDALRAVTEAQAAIAAGAPAGADESVIRHMRGFQDGILKAAKALSDSLQQAPEAGAGAAAAAAVGGAAAAAVGGGAAGFQVDVDLMGRVEAALETAQAQRDELIGRLPEDIYEGGDDSDLDERISELKASLRGKIARAVRDDAKLDADIRAASSDPVQIAKLRGERNPLLVEMQLDDIDIEHREILRLLIQKKEVTRERLGSGDLQDGVLEAQIDRLNSEIRHIEGLEPLLTMLIKKLDGLKQAIVTNASAVAEGGEPGDREEARRILGEALGQVRTARAAISEARSRHRAAIDEQRELIDQKVEEERGAIRVASDDDAVDAARQRRQQAQAALVGFDEVERELRDIPSGWPEPRYDDILTGLTAAASAAPTGTGVVAPVAPVAPGAGVGGARATGADDSDTGEGGGDAADRLEAGAQPFSGSELEELRALMAVSKTTDASPHDTEHPAGTAYWNARKRNEAADRLRELLTTTGVGENAAEAAFRAIEAEVIATCVAAMAPGRGEQQLDAAISNEQSIPLMDRLKSLVTITDAERERVSALLQGPEVSAQLSKLRQALRAELEALRKMGIGGPNPMDVDYVTQRTGAIYSELEGGKGPEITVGFLGEGGESELLKLAQLRHAMRKGDVEDTYWPLLRLMGISSEIKVTPKKNGNGEIVGATVTMERGKFRYSDPVAAERMALLVIAQLGSAANVTLSGGTQEERRAIIEVLIEHGYGRENITIADSATNIFGLGWDKKSLEAMIGARSKKRPAKTQELKDNLDGIMAGSESVVAKLKAMKEAFAKAAKEEKEAKDQTRYEKKAMEWMSPEEGWTPFPEEGRRMVIESERRKLLVMLDKFGSGSDVSSAMLQSQAYRVVMMAFAAGFGINELERLMVKQPSAKAKILRDALVQATNRIVLSIRPEERDLTANPLTVEEKRWFNRMLDVNTALRPGKISRAVSSIQRRFGSRQQ